MLSIDQLLQTLTRQQVEDSLLAAWGALGLPTTAWQPGGKARTILAVVSQKIADLTEITALVARSGFLDTAEGGWLTIKAKYDYDVDRIVAAAAPGTATLTNANVGALGPFAAGELHVANLVTGKTYTNTAAVTVPGSGTASVAIACDELGTVGNAAIGEISVLVSPTIAGLTVTNAAALVGVDEETDAKLRERCRLSLASKSPNGPKAAYEYRALSAVKANGASVGVTRTRVMPPAGDGSLDVYVASDTGPVTGTVGDTSTDLGIVDDDIQDLVVPEGMGPVTVASAAALAINITGTLWIYTKAGLTANDVRDLVGNAITEYFKTIPIGGQALTPGGTGYVWRNALLGAIEAISPYVLKAELTLPAGDTALAEDEVPILGVFNAGTFTVNLVAGP